MIESPEVVKRPEVKMVAWVVGKQKDFVFVRVIVNELMVGELMVNPEHVNELVRRIEGR
jgi:hypothetical protein